MTRGCAAGCVQPGHDGCGPDAQECPCACHNGPGAFRPPCDQAGGCGPHNPDPGCHGCRPRPATHGVLCDRCDNRLTSAICLAADLVIHLRASIPPGSPPDRAGGKPTKAAEPPPPLNLAAADHADRIYVLLRAATGLAVSELPGMVGPPDQPAWRTWDPDNGMWTDNGLTPGSTGVEAAAYTTWLWAQLPAITAREWVTDLLIDDDDDTPCLATAIHRANHAYPMSPPRAPRSRQRCPYCRAQGIVVYTPTGPGLPPVLSCANCAATLTASAFGRTA